MTAPAPVGVAVLVVSVKPDARRVLARWGGRFPELAGAVVLSRRRSWSAAAGVRAARVFVDEDVLADTDRRVRELLQRLNRELRRTGGEKQVQILPRLAENQVVVRDIVDVMFGRL